MELAANVLQKFEQACSEIHLYDLAVRADCRRQGIPTALIQRPRALAAEHRASSGFVQADTEQGDEAAIALCRRLGSGREVLHVDIGVEARALEPG